MRKKEASPKLRACFLPRSKLKAGLAILLLLLLLGGFYYFSQDPPPPPEIVLAEALQNLQQAQSYRFNIDLKYTAQDFAEQLNGCWQAPDRIWVQGNFLNNENSEIIQIGRDTWLKAPWSQKWSLFSQTQLSQTEIFFLELNPQLWYQIPLDTPIIQVVEKEEKPHKHWLVELQPALEAEFWQERQLSFHYWLELEPESRQIIQAKILASTPEQENYFELRIKWSELNQTFTIEPPIVSSLAP